MVSTNVQILNERETPVGLSFRVALREGASTRSIEVRMHWADYNLWSPDGADPPERVATAAVRLLCSRVELAELPETFDAATLRRRFADADSAISALLRGSSPGVG